MTLDKVAAADADWFKKNINARQYIRRAFDVERAQAIATNSGYADGPTLVIVSQLEHGWRERRMICVPDEKFVDYVLRNQLECVGFENCQPYLLIPGSLVNGRVLQ